MVNSLAAQIPLSLAVVREHLARVCDPEIPSLSIEDLGILRDVTINGDAVHIVITPSYSGCPAMHTIAQDIEREMRAAGASTVNVETRLAPAWTSDWLSAAGRAKLLAAGIAPPASVVNTTRALIGVSDDVACPRCRSASTELVSEFGSTACKALYRCLDCLEPFDYFKCL